MADLLLVLTALLDAPAQVQNKVGSREARALHDALTAGFEPYDVPVTPG